MTAALVVLQSGSESADDCDKYVSGEQDLTPSQHLVGGCSTSQVAAGEILCRESDAPGPAYVVVSGSLRVYRQDRQHPEEIEQLAELGKGALVGELSSLLNQPRSATVEATTPTEVLVIPGPQLHVLAQENAALLRVLVLALQERAGLSPVDIAGLAQRLGVDLSPVEAFVQGVDGHLSPGLSAAELPVLLHDTELVYLKSVRCPACGATFSAPVFRSHKERRGERDTDFYQRYRTRSTPYDYEIWVCPNDLYAAFPTDFAGLRPGELEGVAEVVQRLVAEQWAGERPDFAVDRNLDLRERSLQLALVIYQLRGASQLRLAGVLHRLAWCAREQGEDQAERRWLQAALEAYQTGYATVDSAEPKDHLRVQYLCGELARRLGDPATALEWFGQVLGHPAITLYPMWGRIARQQWALVRETARTLPDSPIQDEPAQR
jgi:uncharacterized protein (DUF2225 family)/CRP-like cAMP-binding protein